MKRVAVLCLLAWTTTAIPNEFRGIRRLARKLQQRRRAEANDDDECAKIIADAWANNAKCYAMMKDGMCMDNEGLTELCSENCPEILGDVLLSLSDAGCTHMFNDGDDGSCDVDEAKTACGDCEPKCNSDSDCTCSKVCLNNEDGVGICVEEDEDPTVCDDSSGDSEEKSAKELAGFFKSGIYCAKNSSNQLCLHVAESDEWNAAFRSRSCSAMEALGCCVGTTFEMLKEMNPDIYRQADVDKLKEGCPSVDFDEVCEGVDLAQINNPSSAYQTGTLLAFVVAIFAAIL